MRVFLIVLTGLGILFFGWCTVVWTDKNEISPGGLNFFSGTSGALTILGLYLLYRLTRPGLQRPDQTGAREDRDDASGGNP